LQTNEQDAERGRTRHEAAGDAKENDLRCGDGATGETLRDVLRVRALVGVLKLLAAIVLPVLVVMMRVFAELCAARVRVPAVPQCKQRVEFVRLGDVIAGFEEAVLGDAAGSFPPTGARSRKTGGTPSSKTLNSILPWPVSSTKSSLWECACPSWEWSWW
jgi:hypothetical protein